ncbi:uncharacterized protein DUF4232 [Actinocorallia herbida]|uniref:Uncharacterized protein DUF4232 n=1 Tax=Actinocorallia herbida TaxID=58109 RepID=A0A3N1CT99_9ACTN|nr:DUF4232 domain-containing protein [Actinocorallia herbida]ROO84536.1 uncharacterized protein DUF4232 [Actinocorallia herbida]
MRCTRWGAGLAVLLALATGCSDGSGDSGDEGAKATASPSAAASGSAAPGGSEAPVPVPTDVSVSVAPPPGEKPPVPSGACPAEGYRILEGVSDAAMGLRVVQIDLQNCGKKPIALNGYPEVSLIDADGARIDVEITHGSGGVASIPTFDAPAQAVTVAPGKTATAGFLWRNLVEAGGENVVIDRVVVTPGAGLTPQRLDGLNLDFGTTREVGVAPWSPGIG